MWLTRPARVVRWLTSSVCLVVLWVLLRVHARFNGKHTHTCTQVREKENSLARCGKKVPSLLSRGSNDVYQPSPSIRNPKFRSEVSSKPPSQEGQNNIPARRLCATLREVWEDKNAYVQRGWGSAKEIKLWRRSASTGS